MWARAAISTFGEYFNEAMVMDEAIHEAYAAGFLGACDSGMISTSTSTEARGYICGEETA